MYVVKYDTKNGMRFWGFKINSPRFEPRAYEEFLASYDVYTHATDSELEAAYGQDEKIIHKRMDGFLFGGGKLSEGKGGFLEDFFCVLCL